MSEKQRDEALGTVKVLSDKIEKMKVYSFKAEDLRGMPIQKLKTLQVRPLRWPLGFFIKISDFPFSQSCEVI